MNQDRRNSLWLATQYIVTIVFSLVTLKLNLTNYGNELFGYWILVSSLWGFGRALDFGLGTSLVKFVAEFSRKDSSKLNYLITTCFILMMFLGIVILFSIYGIGWFFYFYKQEIISEAFYSEVFHVYLILGISFYLNYVSLTFKSIFDGLSNFVTSSQINIIYSFLILISVITCYVFNLPLVSLSYFYLISSIINIVFYLSLLRIKYPSIHISSKLFEYPLVKKVFSFSLSVQGAAMFGSMIDPLIKFLISNYSSVSNVSIYEIARKFVLAISGLFNNTFSTILPKASALSNNEEYTNFIYDECSKLSKMGIIYSGIVFGVGAFIIPIIIDQFFNHNEAVLIFFILALPESINNFGFAIYNFLIGIEKAYFLIFVQFINVLVVGLSVFIGLIYFNNLLGLLGFGVAELIVNILMLIFIQRKIGVSIKKYLSLSKVYKLFILLLFLTTTVLSIFYGHINIYIVPLNPW